MDTVNTTNSMMQFIMQFYYNYPAIGGAIFAGAVLLLIGLVTSQIRFIVFPVIVLSLATIFTMLLNYVLLAFQIDDLLISNISFPIFVLASGFGIHFLYLQLCHKDSK